jgi:hypothetical protein
MGFIQRFCPGSSVLRRSLGRGDKNIEEPMKLSEGDKELVGLVAVAERQL